jgi:dTDP-4-dehydrorhamnose reductase
MSKQIAIIGARGQLGTDLQRLLDDAAVALRHDEIEITDADSVEVALGRINPKIVINTAAYNLVDEAENEPTLAFQVNALGPRNLSLYCASRNITLVHVSTDYVFGQQRDRSTPYTETDVPGPVSAYGVSKLAGEHFVRGLCPRHYVVRTCGLYGQGSSADGKSHNFVETMLALGAKRDSLSVVDDQCCTPTASADLATAIVALIETDAYGLYHVTNQGNTTWYGLACEIFRLRSLDVAVTPITSTEFNSRAQRPGFSVLDTSKFTCIAGQELPAWQDALATYLNSGQSSS